MIRLTTEYEGRKMSVGAAMKRLYATQGWRFLEVVGRFATDALPAAHFSSPTARTITAVACTQGVQTSKAYTQRNTLFLTVTMQRPINKRCEGDRFVLVFSKPKNTPNKSLQPTPRIASVSINASDAAWLSSSR